MGFKEFFKFTKGKVIAWITLVLFSGISYLLLRNFIGFGASSNWVVDIWEILMAPLIMPPIAFFAQIAELAALNPVLSSNSLTNFLTFVIYAILILLYQYLLVCIFAWIINGMGRVKK